MNGAKSKINLSAQMALVGAYIVFLTFANAKATASRDCDLQMAQPGQAGTRSTM